MKKYILTSLLFAFAIIATNPVKSQILFPMGAFGIDTPDIQDGLENGNNNPTPTSNIPQLTPKRTLEDSLLQKDETEIKKLELKAQRIKLEREIAELTASGRALSREDSVVLRIKTENLRLVAERERLILEQDLQDAINKTKNKNLGAGVVYGHQFFRDGNFDFYEKTDEIAVPENYILGTGDLVQLEVWGYRYWSNSYVVSETGSIDIAGYQKIFVKGLTLKKARELIGNRLGLGNDQSSYSVSITRPRLVTVTILGEVFSPGTYTLPATNSAFNALVSMGGPSNLGSVRNIYIKRDGVIKDSFDVYEFANNATHSKDIYLQNNDFIIVGPLRNIVNISGGIKRPGAYEIKAGEGLSKLIQYAGGSVINAYLKDIVVYQIKDNKYERFSINLDSLLKKRKDFILSGGETVEIKTITPDNNFSVLIKGAVSVPGSYKVRKGMRISDLIKNANGLTSNAYLEKAYLLRTGIDFKKTYFSFSPSKILASVASTDNILVEERDTIYIFSKDELTNIYQISISGSVRNSIRTQYIEGLKASNLIFMAGGLTEDAELDHAFIVRTDANLKKTLIRFSPGKVLNGEAEDLEIFPRDEVVIYSKTAYLQQYNLTTLGALFNPGTFAYTENTRITDLLERSGGLKPTSYLKKALLISTDEKTKVQNIRSLNLEEIIMNPNSDLNFELQPRDQLRVFDLTEMRNDFQVDVYGAVEAPGSFAYIDNLTLEDLIYLSGGIKLFAAGGRIEVIRNFNFDNGNNKFLKTQSYVFNVSEALQVDSTGTLFKLQPFDRVFVRNNPNYVPFKFVTVVGAVPYPGVYALTGDNEKIASIIKRAGGLKPEAFRDGTLLKRARKPGDTIEIVMNLKKALNKKGSSYNYILKDGDVIHVPVTETVVTISGVVRKNTDRDIACYYKRGKRAGYYIRNFGGGFDDGSYKKGVVVKHANGARVGTRSFLFVKIYPKVKKGSIITVPQRVEKSGGGRSGSRFNIDSTLNKLITRSTAVFTLIALFRIATQ